MLATPDVSSYHAVQAISWRQLAFGSGAVFVVAVLLAAVSHDALAHTGQWLVERCGLGGLFGITLVIDALPTPLSYVPLMLVVVESGLSPWVVLAGVSIASTLAGLIGYGIGRTIGLPIGLRRFVDSRYPNVLTLLERHGAMGIVIVGVLPLPFALGTWTAGVLKVRFWQAALACLVRLPKAALYLGMIMGGSHIGELVRLL